MSFPVSLELITLTGTFLDGESNPRAGVVTVTLPTPIRSEGDDVVIPPFDLVIELDDAGGFQIELPATTDPQWLPNTVEYVVQAVFSSDFRKLWWMFPLPFDGGDLDLADAGAPNVGTPSLTIRQGTTQPLADGGYKGMWANGTLYRAGDTVQHSSSVYGALRASSGVTPGTAPTTWKVFPSSGGGGAVDSVNGQTGDVVLDAGDVGADVSGAAATVQTNLTTHIGNTSNPHAVTKAQVGLGSVDNTADSAKPVSSLQAAADSAVASTAAGNLAAHASDTTAIHGIADTSVLATQSDLTLKAPLASPALTGTASVVNLSQSGRYLSTPDALTDAATIAVDASAGNDFTVTLTADRVLGNPTNSVNGQKIMFAIRQDGTGGHTLTLDTNYRLGVDIDEVVLSTGAGKIDYLGARYNGTDSKWDVIAFVKGY
jgi:hypothetical protein